MPKRKISQKSLQSKKNKRVTRSVSIESELKKADRMYAKIMKMQGGVMKLLGNKN